MWGVLGLGGLAVKEKGRVVKVSKFQGPACIKILPLLYVSAETCKIDIKS
jgi:hypothetical protein